MEQIQEQKRLTKKEKTATATIPVRIKKETARLIRAELNKLNNKKFGRKVKPDELISRALTKLTDEDRKELQNGSLSGSDKIALMHHDYCAKNGPISKDAFLTKLISGEVSLSAENGTKTLTSVA